MLQEPDLGDQKPVESVQNPVELLFGAIYRNLLGFAAVQREHAHEGGGVNLEAFTSHQKLMGKAVGNRHKILNIPQAMELHRELPHNYPPKTVQN